MTSSTTSAIILFPFLTIALHVHEIDTRKALLDPLRNSTDVYLTPLSVLTCVQSHNFRINLSILSVPFEGYSRNASCELNLISPVLLIIPSQSGLCILYIYNFCRLIRSLNNIGCKLDNLLFFKFL